MPLPVAVQAEQDKVGLGKVNGKGSIGQDVDYQEAHGFRFPHQIPQRAPCVAPQECFSSAEEKNTGSHLKKPMHLSLKLSIRMDDGSYIVYRAVLAF